MLKWEELSPSGTDNDYSLGLQTGAGATSADPAGLHLEFDSDETIDHFDGNSWWKQFHSAVDAHGAKAGDLIDGDRAVVTGLAGLDTAHLPALESHPVYAMAIQTDRKAAVAGGTDRWAIFARSWGNEGYCSQYNHMLPSGPLTIRIPWQDGASGALASVKADPARQVTITGNDMSSNISPHGTLATRVLPGEGVLLTFDLTPPASHHPLYWGTIDLKWTFGPPPILTSPRTPSELPLSPSASASTSVSTGKDEEDSDVEALVARLWRRLPRAIRSRALAHIPRQFVAATRMPVQTMSMQPPISPLRQLFSAPPLAPLRDPAVIALGTAEKRALCDAYREHVPRFPNMCRPHRRS